MAPHEEKPDRRPKQVVTGLSAPKVADVNRAIFNLLGIAALYARTAKTGGRKSKCADAENERKSSEAALHQVIDAANTHRTRFMKRLTEPDTQAAAKGVAEIFKRYPPKPSETEQIEQIKEIESLFAGGGYHLAQDRIVDALKVAQGKADDDARHKGPRGRANLFVGEIFEVRPRTVQNRKGAPPEEREKGEFRGRDEAPSGFTTFAFGGGVNASGIAKYVLRLCGWTDEELQLFDVIETARQTKKISQLREALKKLTFGAPEKFRDGPEERRQKPL